MQASSRKVMQVGDLQRHPRKVRVRVSRPLRLRSRSRRAAPMQPIAIRTDRLPTRSYRRRAHVANMRAGRGGDGRLGEGATGVIMYANRG